MPSKIRIFRFDNSYEAILVFRQPIGASLFLFLLIKGYDAGAETKPDKLMPAADGQHRQTREL